MKDKVMKSYLDRVKIMLNWHKKMVGEIPAVYALFLGLQFSTYLILTDLIYNAPAPFYALIMLILSQFVMAAFTDEKES